MRPRLALTTGDPAGIGPEVAVAALARLGTTLDADVTLIGNAALLRRRAGDLALPWRDVQILDTPLAAEVVTGRLDARNAAYVLATLDAAIDGCRGGRFDAIVTAPVHKGIINDAGVPFSGHTEYLAERTGSGPVVMMLAGSTPHGPLRVALATTHLPLAAVDDALTIEGLVRTLHTLHDALRTRFGIAAPRIAVTGLNPHAGEGGHLGREEIDVIGPALECVRVEGIAADGPLPADTLFVPDLVRRYDAVLAMFHDQGLPVLKYATFGHGVNITLGLPFVRTSVDHGTALDLAGTGRADAGSMEAALRMGADLVRAAPRH